MNQKIIDKLNEINQCLLNYEIDNTSLMVGQSGIILYKSYYNKVFKVEKFDINNELETLFSKLPNEAHYLPFCGGFTGAAWMFSHLIKHKLIDANIEEVQTLDEIIEERIEAELMGNNYDYLHGALGMAWYLLDSQGEKKKEFLGKIVIMLKTKAKSVKTDMIYWETADGVVNLSVSHGITSVLLFLAECYKYGIEKEVASDLIKKGINYIRSYKRLELINHSYFPNAIEEKMLNASGRLAWCYGDLGIATLFYKVGKLLNDSPLQEEAIQIFEENSKRMDLKLNNVIDGTFCHGASGICYIFFKNYLETNNDSFKDAADYWLEKIFEFGNNTNGFAGFKTWNELTKSYENNYCLLEGISGIGLVLLSIYSNQIEDTAWDKCLLLS